MWGIVEANVGTSGIADGKARLCLTEFVTPKDRRINGGPVLMASVC